MPGAAAPDPAAPEAAAPEAAALGTGAPEAAAPDTGAPAAAAPETGPPDCGDAYPCVAAALAVMAAACKSLIRPVAPVVCRAGPRVGSRRSPRLSWATNHAGRYPSIGRPGLTASHHSRLGQVSASSAYATRRAEPA